MKVLIVVVLAVIVLLIVFALAVRIVKQYERRVLFRFGRVLGERKPGFRLIVPFVDVLHRVSLRIVTMPIQSQGIITRDNVSVDVSVVAYRRLPRTRDGRGGTGRGPHRGQADSGRERCVRGAVAEVGSQVRRDALIAGVPEPAS